MESLILKYKSAITIKNILYSICFAMFIGITYKYNTSYNFIVLILKCSFSTLIVVLMVNVKEKEVGYIFFIGIGYIMVNAFEFIGVIYAGRDIFSTESTVVAILIELLVFIVAINYISKKDIINKTLLKIMILVSLMMVISCEFRVNIVNIAVFLNLLLLLYIFLQRSKDGDIDNTEEFNSVKKILILRGIHFICLFLYNLTWREYYFLDMLSDTFSVIQIYLIYKIIIQNNLINPYIDIIENNEKIEHQNIIESNASIILNKMKELQEGINEKLIYKEMLYQSILATTPNGIVIFDKDGSIKEFNKSFGDIVENKSDILTAIDNNILNKDKFYKNALEVYKERHSIEDEIITKNNKVYKCSYYINDQGGDCICNLLDITQEMNISRQLIELKKEYEDLIVNVGSSVYIFDESDNVINYTKSYKEFFDQIDLYDGINNKKINIEKKYQYKIVDDDFENYKKAIRTNKNAECNSELYNKGYLRYRVTDYLGNVLWIESITKIYYDHNKKYIMKSYANITEYINAKLYLEKTKKLYEALLDSVPEAIYLEDLDNNRYTFINKKFRDMFNVDYDIVDLGLCRHDLMKIYPGYEGTTLESIVKIRDNQISDYVNMKYLNMEGMIIEAKTASIPFKMNNKIYKLTIIKDMKDIKNIERLRKRIKERTRIDKLKMEFFVNMSHELKTPLNLIFTSTQLIDNLLEQEKIEDLDNKIAKHINLTKQNSYRLLKIISDLIDFTKMESGYYKLRMENKNIVTVVEDIVMSVVTYAKSKEIDLIFDTDIEELIMAVDMNAIERILLNILSNAIKFTGPKGFIYVNLLKRDNHIDIEIEDTGIGIESDKINLIFDRFNDVNKGFIGNIYGSGIGLSMVKSMANLIQGDVKVESKYGQGTKFTVSLNRNVIKEQKSVCTRTYDTKDKSNIERLVVDMADIYN